MEVQSTDAASAIASGRWQVGMGPIFVFCLLGFAYRLRGNPGYSSFQVLSLAIAPILSEFEIGL